LNSSLVTKGNKILFVLICVILFFFNSAFSTVLEITKKSVVLPQGKIVSKFKSLVSQKNLLNLKRESPTSLPSLENDFSQIKTIKICALRVQFQNEVPDDPLTTGNGNFDMRTGTFRGVDTLIDPPPHNRLFFEKHLLALDNYWQTVSQGKLKLEYEVFPSELDSVYTLSHQMSYYGSPDSSDYPIKMLERFMRDVFHLVDSASSIDFSLYQSFVILHAGSGKQSDWMNDTPADLYTGFMVLGTPILANYGQDTISEAVIMPETYSQDNRIGAINADFAHEFGHQLGLPDLYKTSTFLTQVGDFSLMDNNAQDVGVDFGGGYLVSGVLPVYPDAWCKAFLGFIQPREVKNQIGNRLFASELLSDSIQSIKIPINSYEYFLIENREFDLDGDNFSGLLLDSSTNVILGPVNSQKLFNREYDFLIPGSGILIWHVDEGVAYLDVNHNGINNFRENTLQWDKDRRFIQIKEADGIVDFGGDYNNGFGSQEDMYYLENNSSFTPYTFPSSRSNNKDNTHIFVTHIGPSGLVMSLDISSSWFQAGWAQRFRPAYNTSSLVYADLNNDDYPEVLLASGKNVYAWKYDGAKVIQNNDSIKIKELNGDTAIYPLAIFAQADTDLVGTPALGDINGDGRYEVVIGTLSGKVYAWKPEDLNLDGRADLISNFPLQFDSVVSTTPVIANFDFNSQTKEIFIGANSGRWGIIDSTGTIINTTDYQKRVVSLATTDSFSTNYIITEDWHGQKTYIHSTAMDSIIIELPFRLLVSNPVCGDINKDGKIEVIVTTPTGEICCWDDSLNSLPHFPITKIDYLYSNPVLGDIDGDGNLEIVVCGENKVYAYNYNGTLLNDFPITPDINKSVKMIKSTPILGDVNNDNIADIIFGTVTGEVFALDGFGKKIDGFPLSCGGGVKNSPIILDLDLDNKIELGIAAEDGLVYFWKTEGNYNPVAISWPMSGFNCGHSNYYPQSQLPPIVLEKEFLPEKSVFNYPNPTKYKTAIRYYLSQEALVNFKFFNLAGDLVDEANQNGLAHTDNEFQWDCSKFASGVYLCRVEAQTPENKKVVFCKIAIVR
jgi:M6 family metalloprotease-like protein